MPWKRKWQLTPVFLPWEFHGQKCLAGYSPWGSHRIWHDCATNIQTHTHTHTHTLLSLGFLSGSVVKNLPANAGDARDSGLIPGSGRSPWSKKWQPTPIFLPEKLHGKRGLVGSAHGIAELDMAEHAHTRPRQIETCHSKTHWAQMHMLQRPQSWCITPLQLGNPRHFPGKCLPV